MNMLERARSLSARGGNAYRAGLDFTAPTAVGHRITASGVVLMLPAGRGLTDAEALKLAWGILADLAPDEVVPTPDVVTYREANRLALMGAMREGAASIDTLSNALGWCRSKTERRLRELLQDGRVERLKVSHVDVRFRLAGCAR